MRRTRYGSCDQMKSETNRFRGGSAPITIALAFAVSTAFAETVAEHADASLGGPGYRGMARLAVGDPSMYESIARENREPMLEAIDQFAATLRSIRERLDRGDHVTELFAAGRHLAV